MASAAGTFKGRDEYRKAAELEEARKAGLAPAAVDEDGKEINPHIPQYMAAAPWYLNNNGPVRRRRKCCPCKLLWPPLLPLPRALKRWTLRSRLVACCLALLGV